MLRNNVVRSETAAKNYFRASLAIPPKKKKPTPAGTDKPSAAVNYYTHGNEQERPAIWHGKLADQLGLGGHVSAKDFNMIINNVNPLTGGKLTPRKRERQFIDFTLSLPKSMSILIGLLPAPKREKINDLFMRCARRMVDEMEKHMQTRQRKNGAYQHPTTGNLMAFLALHLTARPTRVANDNTPDPHAHIHIGLINCTYDETEDRIKAAEYKGIYDRYNQFHKLFLQEMEHGLNKMGYNTHKTTRSFEVDVIPAAAVELFSKRTKQINQMANDRGITEPEVKAMIGPKTRGKKRSDLTMDQLRQHWLDQIHKAGLSKTDKKAADSGDKGLSADQDCAKMPTKSCRKHKNAPRNKDLEKFKAANDTRRLRQVQKSQQSKFHHNPKMRQISRVYNKF